MAGWNVVVREQWRGGRMWFRAHIRRGRLVGVLRRMKGRWGVKGMVGGESFWIWWAVWRGSWSMSRNRNKNMR
jgi:hypothetical protein